MIHVETKVKLPFLWGKAVFKKSKWSQINLIVGPNGSGKTLLAQNIIPQFEEAGYKCKYLSFESNLQNEILNVLNYDLKVRSKIEDVLSNMFGKSIKFEKNEKGILVPIVINKAWNVEYNLKDAECHGLKEILTLLVSLYSNGENCLIFDEPELHLHPQFQRFFMNEIQKVAKAQPDKVFIIISHSPFFIDLRSPKDLIGVVVCHINTAPTFIEKLNRSDEHLFRKFLPRFNTYHKQFFFSDNQIFVEGYTDQQMFSILLSRLETPGSAGTGIIDVGGKDELGVFCKVCNLLGTHARIIGDLDSLFQGKLRDVVCKDKRVQKWLSKQFEKQLPFYKNLFPELNYGKHKAWEITLSRLVEKLEEYIVAIGNFLCNNNIHFNSSDKEMENTMVFLEKCRYLYNKYDNPECLDTYKTVVLQGINELGDTMYNILPLPIARTVPLIKNLSSLVFAAAEAARVYILNRGCIEHYYKRNNIKYMPISSKDKLFHTEYNYIMECGDKKLKKNYAPLIEILNKACER